MVGQPPKDIACPSDRIFGAVGSGDDSTRREWLKVEVEATSLQSCIKACYGYRYCYSVSFDPRLSTRPCVFYLHTSANCAARKLTPIGELSAADSSVFVECLKCATEEEALRDSSPLGVDYVKKTDLAGTKILFHTDGESDVANQYEGKSNDSPMGSGLLVADNAVYARACTVTFQVAHDLSALGFQPDQEATVASLNECAFICYQNSCTGAIYEPPTGTSNAAKCRIAVRQRENCSGALQNHYSFNSHTTVALSCFRCVPNRPTTLSPDAEIITSTISSLSPQQPEITEPQTDVESTIQLVHLKHGCSIAFQAESPDKRPKEFQSTFDTSLVVETAGRDGCTGALFLPEQKLCKLGYGDRHSCSYGPLITHFVPATTPAIKCGSIASVVVKTNLKNPKEVTLSRVTGGESTATPSPVAVGRDESRPATSESPGEYEASTTPAAGTVQPIEAPTTAEGDEKPASSAQPQETTAESRVTSTPGQLPPEAETEAPEGNERAPRFATTQQPQEAPRGSTVPTDDLIPAEGVITTGEPREETTGAEQKEAATTILPVEASEQPVPTTQPSVEKLLTTAEQEN
ncbi:Apple domain-containing protein [Aphelenchoides fujianensis]|nr:Apple domain-containing protein [Aphelenchoides fujianensis]